MESKERNKIPQYISDLRVTTEHALKAIRKQKETSDVQSGSPGFELRQKMEEVLMKQVEDLEKAEKMYDEVPSKLKEKVSDATGFVAGLIGNVRTDPASKQMRDNYTALGMISAGTTMLKTVALADDNKELQEIAGKHLRELAKLTVSVSKMIPVATAKEIIDDEQEAKRIGNLAIEKTQKAWSTENMQHRDKVLK